MGGRVSVINKTSGTIRVQLCQVSVLYSKTIAKSQSWTQETGAVHFTVKIDVIEFDDILFGPEIGLVRGRTKLFDSSDWPQIEKYFSLSSPGWYFRGDNVLEITGGPQFTPGSSEFTGLPLKINRMTPFPVASDRIGPTLEIRESERNQTDVNQNQAVDPKAKPKPTSSDAKTPSADSQIETSIDDIFEKMAQSQSHLRVQKIKPSK